MYTGGGMGILLVDLVVFRPPLNGGERIRAAKANLVEDEVFSAL